jgi:peptidoglycan hydrolase-like protein with peptidoglycan-binding domain
MAVFQRFPVGVIVALAVAAPVMAQAVQSQDGLPLSSKPSFDCSQAQGNVARILCSDPKGALADWDLNSAGLALKGLLDPADRDAFDQDEFFWLRGLSGLCALPRGPDRISMRHKSCVINAYHGRAGSYRRQLNGDALAESKLSPEEHGRIQKALAALGFLQDRADAKFGPRTREGIRRYQSSRRMPQTGFLTREAVKYLLADDPDARTGPATGLGGDRAGEVVRDPQSQPTPSPLPTAIANVRDDATAGTAAQTKAAEAERARMLAEEQATSEHVARVAAEDRASAADERAEAADRAKRVAESKLAEAAADNQFGLRGYSSTAVALFTAICAFGAGFAFARMKTGKAQGHHFSHQETTPVRSENEDAECDSDRSTRQRAETSPLAPPDAPNSAAGRADSESSLPEVNAPTPISPDQTSQSSFGSLENDKADNVEISDRPL